MAKLHRSLAVDMYISFAETVKNELSAHVQLLHVVPLIFSLFDDKPQAR